MCSLMVRDCKELQNTQICEFLLALDRDEDDFISTYHEDGFYKRLVVLLTVGLFASVKACQSDYLIIKIWVGLVGIISGFFVHRLIERFYASNALSDQSFQHRLKMKVNQIGVALLEQRFDEETMRQLRAAQTFFDQQILR